MNITAPTLINEKTKEWIDADDAFRATQLGEATTREQIARDQVYRLREKLAIAEQRLGVLKANTDRLAARHPEEAAQRDDLYRILAELRELRGFTATPTAIAA